MDSQYAVKVKNLGKKYKIGAIQNGDETLIRSIAELAISPFRRTYRMLRGEIESAYELDQDFWALRDVSFNVKHGEVVGVIGRNGAGKSTLLKLLSSITEPSEGRIELNGRVGSLLEVGTGFHSELTGRENVYLNGTILGMTREEVKRKFDDIVQFAGVEQFIDTPVKHYSSGMSVRLGFAVAAHLEPEILIIDEVLSVGDAEFQKKSIGKMSEVASQGRTVLFVSHNLASVENLCDRAILLENGNNIFQGTPAETISTYLTRSYQDDVIFADVPRRGNGKLRVIDVYFEDSDGQRVDYVSAGESATICFRFINNDLKPDDRISLGFSIKSQLEVPLTNIYSSYSGDYFQNLPSSGTIRAKIEHIPFTDGEFFLNIRVVMNGDHRSGEVVDAPDVAVPFRIRPSDYFHTGDLKLPRWGHTLIRGEWDVKVHEDESAFSDQQI